MTQQQIFVVLMLLIRLKVEKIPVLELIFLEEVRLQFLQVDQVECKWVLLALQVVEMEAVAWAALFEQTYWLYSLDIA